MPLKFVAHSQTPIDYFNDPKYFGTEIWRLSLGKLHLFFADAHVLPDVNLCLIDSNALSLELHPKPCGEDVRIGHSRRRHVYGRVNRVIIALDKFRKNVYITMVILKYKVLVESFADRSMSMFHDVIFHFGIFAHL